MEIKASTQKPQKNKEPEKKTDEVEKLEVLPLSESEKLKMTEDLIVNGFCTYKFNIGTLSITIKSLTFDEQKLLTAQLSSIPKTILADDGVRDKTISEYNLEATEYIIKAQTLSIGDQEEFHLGKLSKHIFNVLSNKIKILNNTIDSVLLSVDNIKN